MRQVVLTSGQVLQEGERVRVTDGLFAGETGTVRLIVNTPTAYGPYQVVWVELPERIEGFKPDRLEKAGGEAAH